MMTAICQDTLNVDDAVYFGDIKDVLNRSLERETSTLGLRNFTTTNGAHFVPGKYNVFYINKHTIVMCLEGADPLKIHKYLMNTNCDDWKYPHLINRYDWKRMIFCGGSTPADVKSYCAQHNVHVKKGVLNKLKNIVGNDFFQWTYIINGNSNLNSISKDKLIITEVELRSEDAPKGFYIMKNAEDNSVIGFVCEVEQLGDWYYGALLEDPNLGHFAFIYSDEHIYNTHEKFKELPNKFSGIVKLQDFLKS